MLIYFLDFLIACYKFSFLNYIKCFDRAKKYLSAIKIIFESAINNDINI